MNLWEYTCYTWVSYILADDTQRNTHSCTCLVSFTLKEEELKHKKLKVLLARRYWSFVVCSCYVSHSLHLKICTFHPPFTWAARYLRNREREREAGKKYTTRRGRSERRCSRMARGNLTHMCHSVRCNYYRTGSILLFLVNVSLLTHVQSEIASFTSEMYFETHSHSCWKWIALPWQCCLFFRFLYSFHSACLLYRWLFTLE